MNDKRNVSAVGQAPQEDPESLLAAIDFSTPHISRIYDYILGGKDNFAVDREAAEEFIKSMPGIVLTIRAGRPVLGRMVRFLVDSGVRQFLDIGAGLPTAASTHEVAQQAAPECRIVYVDNDPMVLAHARALLTSTPEGRTSYLDADLRDTDRILDHARTVLDFSQPVAIMLMAILHYIEDLDQAHQIVARLLDAVPSGSFLVITHAGIDLFPEEIGPFEKVLNQHLPDDHHIARTRDAVTGLFDGCGCWSLAWLRPPPPPRCGAESPSSRNPVTCQSASMGVTGLAAL